MIGQIISHYKILEKLGEGGMGVVYKAEDTTLKRVVALKFLPQHVNASEMDKARFLLEAQAAASLNHPNICTIHGIEEHDHQIFIVMEYVDGQTLRQKMGAMNMKQALDVGVFVAEGLAAAHEKGIVHRDIKPENVMIRKDGMAQIMDFGLAKLRSNSSKINRLTKEGSTVGTAGYMSPEQVQGHDSDHRSDIFSLGVVLYELFTGQLPFRGVHETALMYEIVNVDAPPMSTVKPDIDSNLDAIILECLEKDPADRYQSVAEVAKDLRKFKRESSRARASRITGTRPAYSSSAVQPAQSGALPASPTPQAKGALLPWILAGIFLLAALAAVAWPYLRTPEVVPRTIIRAQILPPAKTNFNVQLGGHLAIAPDGHALAFVATDSTGVDLIWVRAIGSLTAVPLAGTEGASYPFWSFDSRSLGYFASGKLKRIEATGGPTLSVCDAGNGRGGTWNRDGIIVFSPSQFDGLFKVSASGGTPEQVTQLDTSGGQVNHRWPHFLPDGRHLLYVTQSQASANENDQVRIVDFASGSDSLLMRGNSNVEYSCGHLLFHRQGTLMAQPFDTSAVRLAGDAVPVVEQLAYASLRSRAIFSASRNGVLVYQSGDIQGGKLAEFDRSGAKIGQAYTIAPLGGRLSHNGRYYAYSQADAQKRNTDIWVFDIERKTNARLTFDPASDNSPVWSPNDDSIVFSSSRQARNFDLYIKSVNGTGVDRQLLTTSRDKQPTDWSRDGRLLAFSSSGDPKTKGDMWFLPMTGDRAPASFLQTEFREGGGSFSPDARWIAYISEEAQKPEIYVRPVEGKEGKWQISLNGGFNPTWSQRGNEIFFTAPDRKFMVASVRITPQGIVTDSVRVLFDLDSRGIVSTFLQPDATGQRFFCLVTELRQGLLPVSLVVNWDEELKKK